MTWIRWETTAPRSEVVAFLADRLGLKVYAAHGLYAGMCCGFGDERTDGKIEDVTDTALEHWAGWDGKRGRFAAAIREWCANGTDPGKLRGWWRNEAALREQQRSARKPDGRAHRPGKSPVNPRGIPGKSPRNPREIPGKSPRNPRGIPEESPVNPRGIPEESPVNPREIPEESPVNPREIPEESPVNPRGIPGKSPGDSPGILRGNEDDNVNEDDNGSSSLRSELQSSLIRPAVQIALAANRGLKANTRLDGFNELIPQQAEAMAATWTEAGIPLSLILATVEEVARRYKPGVRGRQPSAFEYFDQPVRQAFTKQQGAEQLRAAATSPAVSVPRIRRLV